MAVSVEVELGVEVEVENLLKCGSEASGFDRSLILTVIYVALSHALTGSFEARRPYVQAVSAALLWNRRLRKSEWLPAGLGAPLVKEL